MRLEKPMRRLLQGDVGSGKTVVAIAALLTAVEAGGQGAIMAPTEVLAGSTTSRSRRPWPTCPSTSSSSPAPRAWHRGASPWSR